MTPYTELYRLVYERELELELQAADVDNHPLSRRAWLRSWNEQHALQWLEFQELLWNIREAGSLDDVVRASGTLHLATAIVEVLSASGSLVCDGSGAIVWQRPLFPPARRTAIAEAVKPLRPDRVFGQLVVDDPSNLRRAEAIASVLPPFGRNILFLGDDDLTSIRVAERVDGEIVVIDRDERVLQKIAGECERRSLRVETHVADLLQPLPQPLRERFDIVHCDPPDGGPYLQAWLRAAQSAAVPQIGTRLFVSLAPRRLGTRLAGFMEALAAQGWVLDRRIESCNAYSLDDIEDPFYEKRSSLGTRQATIYTDLFVFRRAKVEPSTPLLRDYRELRRGV